MNNNNSHIPAGYKLSPLGPIPEDWEVKRLGEICTHFKSGITITSKEISDDGLYPVYGGNGLRGYANTYTHNGNFILIGRQGALCGNINYVEGKNYISEHAIAVQTDENIQWLKYKLVSWNLNRFSESSAQPGLSVEKLVRYKLSVPTRSEQIKIADILSLWDTAIEKQTALIEKLTLRKRGLMQELLTGKKRLKGFSGEWKNCTYSYILSEVKRTLIWDEDELYKLISVRRRSEGLFFRESLYGREIATKNLRPAKTGDFLISKMQIVHGASGLVTEEFDDAKISGSYIALVSKDSDVLDIEYFNLWSQTPVFYHQTFVSSFGVHIEKMTFDFDTFMSFSMPLPPISEQHAIVSIIYSINKEIELANKKLARLQEEKKGLMQVLLTGRKRIK
ncbi:MAG: restriction endonuclease subunit S [Salinivirgaceae bacterium]|nr:restriction endonuclease subunit S [Salinivirgaceae bacterium]